MTLSTTRPALRALHRAPFYWRPGTSLLVQHRCYVASANAPRARKPPPPEAPKSKEEALELMGRVRWLQDSGTADVNSMEVELSDLHIPTMFAKKSGAGLFDHLTQLSKNVRNRFHNMISMYYMAKAQSVPGIKVKSPFSPQLFFSHSTRSTSWLAPFRKGALESYLQLNEAIAARDTKKIRSLSTGSMVQEYNKIIHSQDPRYSQVWRFHGERTPCQVVSLRARDSFVGSRQPEHGSTLLVQALVRFDTLQSVETRLNKTGALVSQSEVRPVVEYLVFQKRMWQYTPWVIRDRLYEGLETKVSTVGL
ncbi:uncharacterized protein BXZ73DRAFT_41786 [Epithele typhae]|uniref:uncharacterized protein n=1 Tax=Epithele typhae TaxID=378194 RepID=UPI002008BD19|nr:uncharacterized protein BXZ73DRAFT_41786 [Epithele typhae]KAH9941717.1 hypothetical protein BXZ73DRAFT_41786 [Epithele typhae]